MSKFLSPLNVREIDDRRWEVLSPLVYESDIAGRIEVPAGLVTDFASVPRIPLVYWLFGDRAHMAAVVHDYLYQTHVHARDVADAVFYEAMAASGIGVIGRWAMWAGVRVGGWHAYGAYVARDATRTEPTETP